MVAQINALVGNATLDPYCKRTENRASGNVCTGTHVYCKKGNMNVHQCMKGQTCSTYMSILALYSVFKRKEILPGLLAHANNSRTQKAEVGDCGLETSLGYRTRAYLKKRRRNSDSWCDMGEPWRHTKPVPRKQMSYEFTTECLALWASQKHKAEIRCGCSVSVVSALGRWKLGDPGIQGQPGLCKILFKINK